MANTTVIDWNALVESLEGQNKQKDIAYRFSNGREFERPAKLYWPPYCTVSADCPVGYVCSGGVCVPE